MNKLEVFLKKNSPIMLTVTSSIGVVISTILAVKATPKALKLINEAKKEKGSELTKAEVVKTTWKCYIPTGISVFSTLSCIIGSQYLNTKHQASLVSAYAVLDKAYKDYISKTEEMYGEEAKEIRNEVIKDNFKEEKIDLHKDKHLFFDYQTMRYFESTFDQVQKAEQQLNEELAASGYVSVNDFYRFLGLPELEYSNHMGWTDEGHYKEMIFEHQRVELDDGLECWLILTEEPLIDYYNY